MKTEEKRLPNGCWAIVTKYPDGSLLSTVELRKDPLMQVLDAMANMVSEFNQHGQPYETLFRGADKKWAESTKRGHADRDTARAYHMAHQGDFLKV